MRQSRNPICTLGSVTTATRSHAYTFTAVPAVAAAADRATNPTTATFRLTHDTAPPEVWLDVPPRIYSGAVSIPIAWGATDDVSGVARYDVQVRVEDGDWTAWLTGTLATEAAYALEEGEWFSFRATATDNVSNAGSAEAASSFARVTKYYYHGGRRVAMRAEGVAYYLHEDHLGSTSLTTNSSGGVEARQLYHPYGTVRYSQGTLPTDFGFTGQRAQPGLGLVFMHARYYHPALGRFISADTIVPNPLNPQLFNRYNYAGNNPVLYNDPDGHGGPLILLGIGIALVVWLAYAPPVYAPEEGEVPTTTPEDRHYGDRAFLDAAPGTGDISDAYAMITGHSLFAGDPQNRLLAGFCTLAPFATAGAAKHGGKILEFFHGTRFAREAFEAGIDAAKGGGQLGPGFYVGGRETAEWFAKWWSKGDDAPRLLKLSIPEEALNDLKIIELSADSPEYRALTKAWRDGAPVPDHLQYLIEDYDAIYAPVFTKQGVSGQLKFNPRAQNWLDQFGFDFEDIP